MGYLNCHLSKLFSKLGKFVATHPKKCVTFPILLTILFGYGITYYNYIDDIQYLYTITGSEHKKAGEKVAIYFPGKASYYDPSRALNIGRFVTIIVTEKEEGNILSSEIWEELTQLDEIVSSVEVDNRNLSFFCVQWRNECQSLNHFLEMKELIPEIENGSLKLSYPLMFDVKTFNSYILPSFLGGINLNDDKYSVQSAKAISMNYNVRIENEEDDISTSGFLEFSWLLLGINLMQSRNHGDSINIEAHSTIIAKNLRGRKWESAVMKRLEEMDSEWKHIKVYRFAMDTFANEGVSTLNFSIPAFLVSGTIASLFAIVTSMQSDCVRSKAMLGPFGLFSALLGSTSAFGVLCICGVPMTLLNCIVPFLLTGLGMDDTFVLIASWRRTNCRDSVPKRLSECYSEAAVSITITSLTDMSSFFVGIFIPIRSIQIFSVCAGTGVVFIYFWHLFFFGGLLAIYGYNEEKNRHSIFWWIQAIPKSKAENVSKLKRWFLVGGYDESDPKNPVNESENSLMAFYRDGFSTAICSKCGQIMIIVSYIAYIMLSTWGLSNLVEGNDIANLVYYDSEISKLLAKQKQYFSTYGYRIQIVIATPLDYSTKETQSRVNEMLQEIYGLDHLTNDYSENWLRDYTRYLSAYQDLYELNVTGEQEFNRVYLEQYSHDGMRTHLDVKFNDDNSSIIASRYIVQTKDVGQPNTMKNVVIDLRKTLKKYKDLNATAFSPWLDFVENSVVIRELAINLVIIAAIVVMVVTILFIPNIFTSLTVCFSIASIELGVVGFLSFLDVNLDIISLTVVVACIGYTVDFSAHISYSYISSNAFNSKDRVREAMHALGLPITQGAITTIVEILGVLNVPSYSFHVSIKVYSLVMIFATFHGLFVLPVLLVLLKPENIKNYWKSKTYSLETGKALRF